jgi:hypothetical protein
MEHLSQAGLGRAGGHEAISDGARFGGPVGPVAKERCLGSIMKRKLILYSNYPIRGVKQSEKRRRVQTSAVAMFLTHGFRVGSATGCDAAHRAGRPALYLSK